MVQYRGPFVLKMPDEAWFNVNMMQKDMLLALELGRQVDVPVPATAAAERDADRRARHGLAGAGFRGRVSGSGAHVGARKMIAAEERRDRIKQVAAPAAGSVLESACVMCGR